MPRSLSGAMQSVLDGFSMRLAVIVKITRKDGAIIAFTSWDSDITVSAQLYKAEGSAVISEIEASSGIEIDNADAIGLLDSDLITESDILAGKYDGASLELRMVDADNLTTVSPPLLTGVIGGTKVMDGRYVVEFRALKDLLRQPIGRTTSPLCDVEQLGDARCGVTLGSFQFSRTVAVVTDAFEIALGTDTHAEGYFLYGRVIMTSGPNNGIAREIKRHVFDDPNDRAVVTLAEPFPYPVSVSETATLEAGCDRRIETCIDRFDNAVNHRGFPHVPGVTYLMKRPR